MWTKKNGDGRIIQAEAIKGENLEAFAPGNKVIQGLGIWGKCLHKLKNEGAQVKDQVTGATHIKFWEKKWKEEKFKETYREIKRRRKRKSFRDGEAKSSGDASYRAERLRVQLHYYFVNEGGWEALQANTHHLALLLAFCSVSNSPIKSLFYSPRM